MTADPDSGDDSAPPRSTRVSAGLWFALAVFLVAQAVFAWTGQDELRRRLLSQGGTEQAAVDKAHSLLLTNTGIAAFLAVVYAVIGLLVLRRFSSVRIAATAVVVVHVVVVLGALAVSVANVIVFVLAGAALITLWTRESSEWVTGER